MGNTTCPPMPKTELNDPPRIVSKLSLAVKSTPPMFPNPRIFSCPSRGVWVLSDADFRFTASNATTRIQPFSQLAGGSL
jgi:hypothetical protein